MFGLAHVPLVVLGFIGSPIPPSALEQALRCTSNADCDDGNPCTDDFCDPYYGCYHDPQNCDDGNPCTDDFCDPYYGCHHDPHNCDDRNACTGDSCDPATGCVFTPDDASSCSDGEPCTPDRCVSGVCVGEDADGDGLGDVCDACPHDPFNDADQDGVCGDVDGCPSSSVGLRVTVSGCDSGVPNTMTPLGGGCMLQDLVNHCGVGARNHGELASCVARLANDLNDQGILTGRQKGRIQQCVARSNPPPLRESVRRF